MRASAHRQILWPAVVLILGLTVGVVGAEETVEAESAPPDFPTKRHVVALFPDGDFYIPPLAGPQQRGFAMTWMSVADISAPDTGDRLFGLKLGAVFGLVRVHPRDQPDRGWQIGIDAGFYGQFDVENSYDNLGWDGFYGLVYSRSLGARAALKVGLHHTSSHIGDEYTERTGRQRLGYTREELAVGASWSFHPGWTTYGEVAYAHELREDVQAPGRIEWGIQYEDPDALWRRRFGWYAALDANVFEERDWEPDLSVQAGLAAYRGRKRWRLGVEYYDGRVPLGEFFFEDQRHVSLGLYLDLNARR